MEQIKNSKGINGKKLNEFITGFLESLLDYKKVLVIFPDYTRFDYTYIIAPLIVKRFLSLKGASVDFLNAGGTHRKMSDAEINVKLGFYKKPENVSYFNHDFDDNSSLRTIGHISKTLVYKKTGGYIDKGINVTVNKLILSDYDIIIALSSTIPHEAAGYSGGLKVFFPGISGPEVIDLFHWAAVLIGLGSIIGTGENKPRDLINAGSKVIFKNISAKVYSFNMVSAEKENGVLPAGLFIDSGYDGFIKCYQAACELSKKIYIKYIDAPLECVVQHMPENYDEIWTAAKGSYKLQRPGVLSLGAEVIIYAPHISILHSNEKMQKQLLGLGYHCRDYVCAKFADGMNVSKNAAAHVINASGPGTYDTATDREIKSFKVTLATAIPEKVCTRLGLGYRDPKSLKKSDFLKPGKLWIEDGGKYLYELKKKNKKLEVLNENKS